MNQRDSVIKAFCTTREAAQLLGVSLRTAQLWVESGLLEAWKTDGGHRRITRESIERLVVNPLARDAAASAPVADEPVSVPRPFTILVVEDDRTLLTLYKLNLSRWSMKPEVITASDGYEALIWIGHRKPDLLITDLQMPGMDGFRMLRTIRSMHELDHLSIVVVSGLEPDDIAANGGMPEGIPVFSKPVPFRQLSAIAENLANRTSTLVSEAKS